jgi:hypothetical protein
MFSHNLNENFDFVEKLYPFSIVNHLDKSFVRIEGKDRFCIMFGGRYTKVLRYSSHEKYVHESLFGIVDKSDSKALKVSEGGSLGSIPNN